MGEKKLNCPLGLIILFRDLVVIWFGLGSEVGMGGCSEEGLGE